MDQAPFAYVVSENDGWGSHVIAIAPTLAEAARLAAPKLPRLNGALFGKVQRVEDKQLADYRATADWLWRDDVDETWWQAVVLPGGSQNEPADL